MKRVVYLIGAGFSAPLGIPTMKNFFQISRKLEISSKPHFKNVFDFWEKSSHVKNYSRINMFNIEELLSLIEMEEFLGKTDLSSDIRNYIADVINYFKIFPNINCTSLTGDSISSDWYKNLFDESLMKKYGYFFLGLTTKSIRPYQDHKYWLFEMNENRNADIQYSIISMNYDMVFEKLEAILVEKLGFNKGEKILSNKSVNGQIEFIKLHGSSDEPNSIIAPTWNKINSLKRKTEWQKAHSLLTAADEVRVLGYSLPSSDTYFRYFLMTCLKDSSVIDKFTVICMDDREKQTYNNYRNFFDDQLNLLMFCEDNIENYLNVVGDFKNNIDINNNMGIEINGIEKGHEIYMSKYVF